MDGLNNSFFCFNKLRFCHIRLQTGVSVIIFQELDIEIMTELIEKFFSQLMVTVNDSFDILSPVTRFFAVHTEIAGIITVLEMTIVLA